MGFPDSWVSKESACNAGDSGSIPGLGRSPGEGNSYPLQYSGMENSMDRGAWWAIVHKTTKSQTWLKDFHFHFKQYLGFLDSSAGKESACNVGDPGSIPGFNLWVRKIPWRREWQPTPIFFPGESHGQRSLAAYSPWRLKGLAGQLTLSLFPSFIKVPANGMTSLYSVSRILLYTCITFSSSTH